MYKLSIPVVVSTDQFRKEETLQELQRAHADRVMLALGEIPFDPQDRAAQLKKLEEYIPYYQGNGMEVGVWVWSFMRKDQNNDTHGCELRISHTGELSKQSYCPLSPGFIADTQEFFTEIAKLNPDIIQFDDDYSITNSGASSARCYCHRHLSRMQEILGEEIDRETLYQKAFTGKSNRYRHAVLQASAESISHFSSEIRKAVDQVNPKIRISLCSVMGAWDMDGTNAIQTAKTLAGTTKPLLRLINAPYWAASKAWGNRLQHTIELGRMQYQWCAGEDIEVMSEGDVYPRPRHKVPASYLEGYDTALRFAGITDGILKYMLDYNSSPRYETGYIDRHVKHEPLYQQIQSRFSHQKSVGVRVYNAMTKYANADMTGIENAFRYGWDMFFSRAARLLTDNTIPTTYEGTGCCGIVFGENARHLPAEALDNGLILDIRAAKILIEQGIDVGIQSIGSLIQPKINTSGCSTPQFLYYPAENEYTTTGYGPESAYEIEPMPDAEVITTVRDPFGEIPDTILYTNGNGQKFMVFCFDAYFTEEDRYRSYAMQRQLYKAVEWLSGKPLPVQCAGHPDLYIQCKKSETDTGVGLWNFFPDEIEEPTILLDKAYTSLECINCTGQLEGNVVKLSQLNPYGFAFFTLK